TSVICTLSLHDALPILLDQFSNPDNPLAHFETTGPEIWRDTGGEVTHFVSAMGTTGTIMGVSRYLKSQRATIQVVGAQPDEGSRSEEHTSELQSRENLV